MPNWCYNREAIAGPKSEIQNLFNNMNEWFTQNEDLEDIVKGARLIPYDPITGKGIRCRGYFVYLPEYYNHGYSYYDNYAEEDAHIYFETYTAWGYLDDMWEAILSKVAPNCNYYFVAVEPGSEIYVRHDPLGIIDVPDYHVDIVVDPEAETDLEEMERDLYEEDLIKLLQEITHSDATGIDVLREKLPKQEGVYININTYFDI